MKRRFVGEEGGFTLVEMLVTIMFMLVVLFSLYNIFDMSIRVFSFGNGKVEAVENARLGMHKMEREIRAAYPYNKGAIGAAAPDPHILDTWTATSIKFGNDLDGNRRVECSASHCESISYDVYQPSGSATYALGRASSFAATPQPVAEYVDYASASDTGLSFRYFRSDGTTEVLPGSGNERNIAVVRIKLKIRIEYGGQDRTQVLTTDVALRNRSI